MRIPLKNDEWKDWLWIPGLNDYHFPEYIPEENARKIFVPQSDRYVLVPNEVYLAWVESRYK